jgi:diguanylate cyclase (GGDEF)-like protein
VLSANHTRLRSLVRSLAVTDERTGLLSRGAYIDCLLAESNRSRAQHTPLSLIVLQIDHGPDVLRQHGDAAVDNYIEHIARALSSAIRQTDIAVKYTAWSLVFILPDTSLENARILAEKLRQVAAPVRPAWDGQELTVSAVVAEATARPADETEDRVTEWINRAESGLDEVRQRGGNSLLSLATP